MEGVSFADPEVNISASVDGGKFCCTLLNLKGQESLSLNDSLNSPDRLRSNSECLVCTGQAPDKLLDDQNFLKDFNNDAIDYNESEEENDSELFSHINYDKYEYQQPLDELDFPTYNHPPLDKIDSEEDNNNNNTNNRDYSLLFEIFINSDNDNAFNKQELSPIKIRH